MPFFSVIVPLYNKAHYILAALDSILAQTFQDFEIIVVDDASTDESKSLVQNLNHSKIRLIEHAQNKGLSASRNTGIKNSTGNYIALLDADDLWKINYLEKIHQLIHQFPEAKLFATGYEELYPNNISILPQTKLPSNFKSGILDDFFELNLAQPVYCSISLCIHQSVFYDVGFYNESITFGEDVDFNIRTNLKYKVAFLSEPLAIYTMFSEHQITNSSLKNKSITDFDSYESYAKANPSLKKYLDFNRYIMAKHYKLAGDVENFKLMKNGINQNPEISGINNKQRILLALPTPLLITIKKLKTFVLQKGIRISSYT